MHLMGLGCTEKSQSLTAWTTSQPSEFHVFRIEFFPVHSQTIHIFSILHVWYPVSWYWTWESKQLPDAVDWLLFLIFVLNIAAQPWNLLFIGRHSRLTFSWPAGHICPTYKESFQVCWDNSILLFLHAAIYLEVSLFCWTSQNAFSHKTAAYKWYCVQCCFVALHTVSFVCGKMHSDWFNRIEILQGTSRRQHGEKVGYCYPADLKRLFVSGTHMSHWSQKC